MLAEGILSVRLHVLQYHELISMVYESQTSSRKLLKSKVCVWGHATFFTLGHLQRVSEYQVIALLRFPLGNVEVAYYIQL